MAGPARPRSTPVSKSAGTVSDTSSGTLKLGGIDSVTSTAAFSGSGDIDLEGILEPAAGGDGVIEDLNVSVDGTLSGPGTLTIPSGATVSVTGSSGYDEAIDNSLTLVNDGTMAIGSNAEVIFDTNGSSSVLENAGTLSLGTDSQITSNDSAANPNPNIDNESTGTVSYGGTGTAALDAGLESAGTVSDTSSGTLKLGGIDSVTSTAAFSGSGDIDLEGILEPAAGGDGVIEDLNVSVDGTLSGPGTLTIPSGATVSVTGSSGYDEAIDNSLTLVNDGTMAIGSNAEVIFDTNGSSSVLENAGTLSLGTDSQITSNDSAANPNPNIDNESTGTVSYGGTGTAALDAGLEECRDGVRHLFGHAQARRDRLGDLDRCVQRQWRHRSRGHSRARSRR